MQSEQKIKRKRSELYEEIIDAFGVKYSWLGAQASRELLMSVASWNIEKFSDPPMRYRTHSVLAWERGWVKSTMLREMADLLGDDMCTTIGKVTDAAMRGSVSAGKFMLPKPLKAPIVVSTEFGQTEFDDELLNLFLNMLEEGRTNISLNKIGQLPESARKSIENEHDGKIQFNDENEYELHSDFVFWGATYDPAYMQDDALRSRFNVVTPSKPLSSEVTKQMDKAPSVKSQLSKDQIRSLRREVKRKSEVKTRFVPPDHLYENYTIIPRESRDIQARMAARNWWGLDVNPEVMENYLQDLKRSRRLSTMSPEERVFELIFDDAKTYQQIQKRTGFNKKHIYKIVKKLDAKKVPLGGDKMGWAVYSGDETLDYLDGGDNDETDDSEEEELFGGDISL